VAASETDALGLLTVVAESGPYVAVVDVRMPQTHTDDGLRAAIELRRRHPAVGILVFSQYIEVQYARRLFADDARGVGYLLKDRIGEVRQFVDALERSPSAGRCSILRSFPASSRREGGARGLGACLRARRRCSN
jgi:DNA-binding NarL/FixJ family response regulator